MMSLLEISAKVAAKHLGCGELEQRQTVTPLDEKPLEMISYWAFPQDEGVILAEAAISHPDIREIKRPENLPVTSMKQVGFMLVCKVNNIDVTVTFEKQHVTSTKCAHCTDIWCDHVIAAVLYRIKHAKEVSVCATLTEVLHRLSRDQLHKLLQYAVADNPTIILGQLFERLDSVRDLNSEINAVQGAPDCTFGLEPEEVSQWDHSLETFKNNCRRDIFLIENFLYFSTSCEEARYKDTRLFRYFHRVIEHVKAGCIDTAGKLLICIGETVVSLVGSNNYHTSEKLEHFVWLLEKFFTHFIMQFSGNIRKDVIQAAEKLNRNRLVKHCRIGEHAQRPVLTLPDQDKVLPDDCRPDGAFYESLCAAFLPDPPEELQILLDGKVSPADSCYDEPLPVMMLRMEGVGIWTTLIKEDEVRRKSSLLGIVILRKLLKLTLKHSVIREEYKHIATDAKLQQEGQGESNMDTKNLRDLVTAEEECFASTSTNVPASSDQGDGKRGKETKNGRKRPITVEDVLPGTLCVKKRKFSETEGLDKSIQSIILFGEPISRRNFETNLTDVWQHENEYTEVTLTYCLLHVCYTVYMLSNKLNTLDEASRQILLAAGFRALEFDRHNHPTQRPDSNCMWDRGLLECHVATILEHLEYHWSLPSKVFPASMTLYIQAILKQREVLDTGTPVVLLGLLSKSTLMLNSSVECSTLAIRGIINECKAGDKLRKSVQEAIALILTPFFLMLDLEKESDILLVNQMFENMIECQSEPVLTEFFAALQRYIHEFTHAKITCSIAGKNVGITQIYLAKFLIHFAVKIGDFSYRYKKLKLSEIISDLCSCVGQEFIDVVLRDWDDVQKILTGKELLDLCLKVKSTVPVDCPRRKNLNEKVLGLVGKEAASPDKTIVEWLKYFEPESQEYFSAMEMIKNGAKGHPFVLLPLAEVKYHRENVGKNSKDPFSKEIMDMFREALREDRESHCEFVHETSKYILDWVYNIFSQRSPTSVKKSHQFQELLDLLSNNFKTNINVLLDLFSAVVGTPLHEVCTAKLGTTMKAAYEHAFHKSASFSSSAAGYNRIIGELQQASVNLKKHHPDGQAALKEILHMLKTDFKKKRMLMGLLDKFFGSVL